MAGVSGRSLARISEFLTAPASVTTGLKPNNSQACARGVARRRVVEAHVTIRTVLSGPNFRLDLAALLDSVRLAAQSRTCLTPCIAIGTVTCIRRIRIERESEHGGR